jgi:hypothetical protein
MLCLVINVNAASIRKYAEFAKDAKPKLDEWPRRELLAEQGRSDRIACSAESVPSGAVRHDIGGHA